MALHQIDSLIRVMVVVKWEQQEEGWEPGVSQALTPTPAAPRGDDWGQNVDREGLGSSAFWLHWTRRWDFLYIISYIYLRPVHLPGRSGAPQEITIASSLTETRMSVPWTMTYLPQPGAQNTASPSASRECWETFRCRPTLKTQRCTLSRIERVCANSLLRKLFQ